MKSHILAMNEGFIGKVEIPAKDPDGEGLQLIFSRKQKKNEVSREVTVLVWWAGNKKNINKNKNQIKTRPSEGQTSWERSCSFEVSSGTRPILFFLTEGVLHQCFLSLWEIWAYLDPVCYTSSYQHSRYLEQILAKR